MQIRPEIALQAVLKSLADVVLPALDPDNKLAQEQAQLVVGLLTLVATRLPLQHGYDVDELIRAITLARAIGVPADNAADTLDRARVSPTELVSAIASLNSAIGLQIDAVMATAPADIRAATSAAVLAAAHEQHLCERSWLLMQGWETDPRSVPAIESLLERPR
jgi:hypothetical protein